MALPAWHEHCFICGVSYSDRGPPMQPELLMLIAEDSPDAGLVMRRSDGRFAFGRIDARVARAARAAAVRAALETLKEEEEAPAPRLIEFKTV